MLEPLYGGIFIYMIKRNCLICNNEFFTVQSAIDIGKGKFCSKKCYGLSKKGKKTNHNKLFKKGHKPWNKGIKWKEMSNEKHHMWKGDKANYHTIHDWLKRNFGKASKCDNPKCFYPRMGKRNFILKEPKRFEWALKRGFKYSHKRKNYIMLCPSCHRQYDRNLLHLSIT